MEVIVHTFSLPRLLQQVFGGEGGKLRALPAGVAMVSAAARGATRRLDPVRAVAPGRKARLCQGIGDGSVHRQ
jgi:hypothetical protein